jgi:hypothetical protein
MTANNFIFHISLNHDGFMVTIVWFLDLEGSNLSDMRLRISSFYLDIHWLDFVLDCFQHWLIDEGIRGSIVKKT